MFLSVDQTGPYQYLHDTHPRKVLQQNLERNEPDVGVGKVSPSLITFIRSSRQIYTPDQTGRKRQHMTITERVDRLPQVLKDMRIWSVVEIGKPAKDGISRKKMHYNHKRNGTFASYAKVDDLTTWGFVEDVADAISQWPLTATVETCLPGIARHGNLLIIDVDWKKREEEGLPETVIDMLKKHPTYAEYSVSGRGVHILYTVDDELDGRNHKLEYEDEGIEIEYFEGNHFVTLTGDRIAEVDGVEMPEDIQHVNEILGKLRAEKIRIAEEAAADNASMNALPSVELLQPHEMNELSDEEILEIIRRTTDTKMQRLWNSVGDSGGSNLDQALCNKLCFYCGNDADRIKRIAFQSSRKRDKWVSHKTYLDGTIQKAITNWDGKLHYKWKKVAAQPGTPSSTVKKPDKPRWEPKFIMIGNSQTVPEEHKWVWPGWIPMGHLTLLYSPSEQGKTFWAAEVAYAVMGLSKFPGGIECPEHGSILWIDYEGQKTTIEARMREAGISNDDPERGIHFIDWDLPKLGTDGDGKDGDGKSFDNLLEIGMEKYPQTKLVIIDSLTGGGTGDENSSRFADCLFVLARWANHTGIGVMVLHHTTKNVYKDNGIILSPIESIRGSSAIVAPCSSVIALERPTESDIRRIKIQKHRLLSDMDAPEPIGYYLESGRVISTDDPMDLVTVDKRDECLAWLISQLSAGPVPSREILTRGSQRGFRERMVRAAAKKEGVRTKKSGGVGQPGSMNMWELPYKTSRGLREAFEDDDE